MATLRELKGRIGSVASSEKITGAMKMISSAKMHKAEQALRRLKPYRANIETIISNLLSADVNFISPLTAQRNVVRHATVVVLGSDDGLCGAYNVNIAKYLATHIATLCQQHGSDLQINIIAVGKKMAKATARYRSANVTIEEAPDNINSKSEGTDIKTFLESLRSRFENNDTDMVSVIYMNYITAGRQRATTNELLPMRADSFSNAGASAKPYIFEPDAATIYATALPMYLLAMMQDIFAENRASEQAARVMAMQSANDNAKKLLDQLQLEYNKLRQQSITTELLDIVGGQVRD